jgi:uncharacterized protein YecE (DUF72 family)
MTIWIGTSGWAYPEWRGSYYPADVPARRHLEYLAGRMPTVEVNGSFYSLQRPTSYQSWHDRTPPGFLFAVKGPGYVTHRRRLREPAMPLANFLASGVLELGAKLGPLLWQFPATLTFDAGRLRDFLAVLPADIPAAARLADGAERMPEGYTPPASPPHRPLRHAIEPRHASFACAQFVDLLAEHGVALVAADTAGTWPYFADTPTDFSYIRLHGDTKLYASRYGDAALAAWADRVRELATRGDVHVYFDNTAAGAAPHDAERLIRLLRP